MPPKDVEGTGPYTFGEARITSGDLVDKPKYKLGKAKMAKPALDFGEPSILPDIPPLPPVAATPEPTGITYEKRLFDYMSAIAQNQPIQAQKMLKVPGRLEPGVSYSPFKDQFRDILLAETAPAQFSEMPITIKRNRDANR